MNFIPSGLLAPATTSSARRIAPSGTVTPAQQYRAGAILAWLGHLPKDRASVASTIPSHAIRAFQTNYNAEQRTHNYRFSPRTLTQVDGILGALDHPPPVTGTNADLHRVFNIGDSHPVGLMEMIATLEQALGVEAKKVFRPMQPGDVTATFADVSRLNALCGYQPKVMLAEGLGRFAEWYLDFRDRRSKPD